MAYKIFSDIPQEFRCKINVEGADISKSKVRLLLESENYTILYNGQVNESGDCRVNINRIKDVFKDNDTGKICLEVIADDVLFNSWSDDFLVSKSKKITVENVTNREIEKPKVQVGVIRNDIEELLSILEKNGINKDNIINRIDDFSRITSAFIVENGIKENHLSFAKKALNTVSNKWQQ